MKRRLKMVILAILVVLPALVTAVPASAKAYSENGTWKRKIGKTTWYFDVNDYTSGTPDEDPTAKYWGVVYIYKGTSNFNKHKYCVNAGYTKLGTNKYQIKYKGGKIRFTVKAKSITLQQKSGKVKGTKLNGKFKLVRRHYS